jgi:2-oxoglutarate ferredoxin oxidoreductase subunit gamma
MRTVKEAIICAGFGGQGVMVLGKFLANNAMRSGFHITWLPSYGAEVRGGTAHSLKKFENRLIPGGLLILNTSMCDEEPARKDIEIIKAPLTEEAIKLGNVKVANMIAAGIYFEKTGIFDQSVVSEVIKEMAKGRTNIIPANEKAIESGKEIGKR